MEINGITDRERLTMAARLAKMHRSGSLLFWTEHDWARVHGVHCERIDGETVRVSVRTIGYGTMETSPFAAN